MTKDFRYGGFANPNGTVVPDDVFDVLAPELTEAELRVLLYIVRRTFGFKRLSDAISLTQLVDGIRTRDGRVLDRGTGMSRRGVTKGCGGLVEKGIIQVERRLSELGDNEINIYSLRFRDEAGVGNDVPYGGEPGAPGVGNDVPYGGERRSLGVGNEVAPQQTVLQRNSLTPFEIRKTTGTEFEDGIKSRRGQERPRPGSASAAERAQEKGSVDDVLSARSDQTLAPIGTLGEGYRRFRAEAVRHREALNGSQENINCDQRAAASGRRSISPAGEESQSLSVATVPASCEPAEMGVITDRPSTKRGRPPGSREERERIGAYLKDFGRELGDQAPLASSITRALNLFRRAQIPPERWGDYLYQARSITQERSGAIQTSAKSGATVGMLAPKPKMGYYFAVLEDLLELKGEATELSGHS